jgi:predicted outer membrane repeat protein
MSKKLCYLICSVVVLALVGFVQADLLVNGDFEADLALVPNPGDTDANAPTGWEYDRYYGYDVDPWLMNISTIGDGSGGDVGVVFGTWNADAAWDPTMATYPETAIQAGQYTLEVTTVSTGGTVEGWLDVQLGWFEDPADPWANYDEYVREWTDVSLFGDGIWTTLTWDFEIPVDDPGVCMNWYLWLRGQSYDDYVIVGDVKLTAAEPGVTIPVDPNSDLVAANESAQPGDTIEFAEGTYNITSQIEIKDGVTYKGAGSGLTIIDGNDATRAFVAWGDRGATNGQVDANDVAIPNLTGPKCWVIEGMTIQNCVADANNRQDILSAARDLLNNYTGTPYTFVTAGEENPAIADNPDAFYVLSGGLDDDLTDVELQAYLDDNPPGSEGHYVINDDKSQHGAALILRNGAQGTIRNCTISDNSAPHGSGDGGAINAGLGSGAALIIDNCEFSGNSSIDGGGAIRLNSGSACTITGTIFQENQAVIESGDGGAIMTSGSGVALIIDNCEFNGNSCIDHGGALRLGANESTHTIIGATFTENTAGADGGAIKADGDDSSCVWTDCSFIGNHAGDDGGAIDAALSKLNAVAGVPGISLEGIIIDGCTAADDGGGMYIDSDAGNDEEGIVAPSVLIDNTVIRNCRAGGPAPDDGNRDGGAMYINDKMGSLTITNTIVDNCTAGRHTAGILVDDVVEICVIDSCQILNCSNDDIDGESGDGVALAFTRDANPDVTVTNCIFANNINNQDDAIVKIDARLLMVANCTFVGNISPKDKGILRFGTSEEDASYINTAINNLFVNNDTSGGSDEIIEWNKDGNTNITHNNCFFGNILDGNDKLIEDTDDDAMLLTGDFVATLDPLVDAAGGDYHLAVGSEAIDAGIADGAPDHDIEGNVRPQGAAPDVGAYESPVI